MSASSLNPDFQNALFDSTHKNPLAKVPENLRSSTNRLEFPPSYVIVGIYRLVSDKALYVPVWEKCRNGTRRGAVVGAIWAFLTFGIQRRFVELFLANSPRVTGLSNETIFGYQPPFSLTTYATVLLLGSQLTYILRFFLSRNVRIARERAWAQTVASRGKGPEFWQPYVEEWDHPPVVHQKKKKKSPFDRVMESSMGRLVLRKVLLIPFDFYPLIGILAAAWIKALGTAHRLHKPYFDAKKMTTDQVAVFFAERKWDYRAFGFTAALVEGLPIIGLVFTISNEVGGAMWAHDLEKRQHFVAAERAKRSL